ncbi:MAG TPA: hypothetical protein VFQ54_01820 [Thermomicrobiales bacterium]|nr:hypothetical protein [Thermomicrobiales bacterium]
MPRPISIDAFGSQENVRPRTSPGASVVIPFVVQRGAQLFLLAAEAAEWVLAELRFDETTCTYAELRKVRYEWPREAFGALLSRVAVAGDVDSDLVEETSEEFSRWLGLQFQLSAADFPEPDA